MLGDLFRSMFGIPSRNRPVDPNYGLNIEGEEFDPFFRRPGAGGSGQGPDGGFGGTFPGGSFFFGAWPPPGEFPGEREDSGQGGIPGAGPSPCDPHGGVPGDAGDLFRHFDDMFRSFDDVFRSMGMADFPAFSHTVPSIEAPPGEERGNLSPRDSMLKVPDSGRHHDNRFLEERSGKSGGGGGGGGGSNAQESEQAGPGQPPSSPTPFDWFFSPPKGDSPTMPQDPLDSDLDDEVRRGDLLQILQPNKTTPFPGVRIMEPRVKQQPEGHIKSVRLYTYRSADGKVEERRTVEDGQGNKQTTVTRTLDGQSHTVTTKRNNEPAAEEEIIQHYQNMDENDKRDFDERWRRTPNLGTIRTPHDNPSKIFDLFRKGFPGFPSKS